jgi:hypothetical protein
MALESIKIWANNNQGFLTLIIFLVSLIIGWFSGLFKWIFNKLFKKNSPIISAGGDIKVGRDIIVGNKKFIQKGGKNSVNIQGDKIDVNDIKK